MGEDCNPKVRGVIDGKKMKSGEDREFAASSLTHRNEKKKAQPEVWIPEY